MVPETSYTAKMKTMTGSLWKNTIFIL